MKNTISVFVLVLLFSASLTAQAQVMKIVAPDGSSQTFELADLEGLTFSEADARGTSDILQLHTAEGTTSYAVAALDSIGISSGTTLTVFLAAGGSAQFTIADVDSLNFASSADQPVLVTYSGASATISNPFADLGLDISVSGGDVIVTDGSGLVGVTYVLSGTATDGMFKVYSAADFNLLLDGVSITNGDGPAINIQADETIFVQLADGTTSTLTDGATYADPPNDEDQKAAFFSEGQLVISGGGSLNINGQGDDQHGFVSDDYIEIGGGTVVINSAVKDGLHTNEGFYLQGGSLEISSDSDGVDAGDGPIQINEGTLLIHHTAADKKALKCDGTIAISGGTVDITVEGDQSKGIDAPSILLSGGDITVSTSGDAVLEASGSGYDPSYCTAVKADDLVQIDGANLVITTSGLAGRGISSDGDITMLSGNLSVTSSGGGASYTNEDGEADAYHGPCLKADGNQSYTGGTITLSHSGSAGKGISGDGDLTIGTIGSGPTLTITTTGAAVSYGWGEAAEAKTISLDNSIIINGGTITLDSNDDGIKSKYRIEVNGGLIDILDSLEGLESPYLVFNGGETHVVASDDALNTTTGLGGEADDGSELIINDGYIHIKTTQGDGIDSNGTFEMNGGTVLVHGPPNSPEVGLDVNGTVLVNGGFLSLSQLNGMHVETPSSLSDQACFLLRRNSTLSAGTLINIQDAAGNSLVTFRPDYRYSSFLFSSADIAQGTTYRVYTGGSCTGTLEDGLYSGGTYSGGTLRATISANGGVQTVNF